MLSVIVWQCECGCMVKAMYNTNGATIVRCPRPSCSRTHNVDGRIVQIWAKGAEDLWQPQDIPALILPAGQGLAG
jgi:hypothetical protein